MEKEERKDRWAYEPVKVAKGSKTKERVIIDSLNKLGEAEFAHILARCPAVATILEQEIMRKMTVKRVNLGLAVWGYIASFLFPHEIRNLSICSKSFNKIKKSIRNYSLDLQYEQPQGFLHYCSTIHVGEVFVRRTESLAHFLEYDPDFASKVVRFIDNTSEPFDDLSPCTKCVPEILSLHTNFAVGVPGEDIPSTLKGLFRVIDPSNLRSLTLSFFCVIETSSKNRPYDYFVWNPIFGADMIVPVRDRFTVIGNFDIHGIVFHENGNIIVNREELQIFGSCVLKHFVGPPIVELVDFDWHRGTVLHLVCARGDTDSITYNIEHKNTLTDSMSFV